MKWLTHIRLALLNLSVSKLRSCLAMLGILVGTAAVVALMSLGLLATDKALEQFRTLGTDLAAISVFSAGPNENQSGQKEITLKSWRDLPQQISEIAQIAPYSSIYQQISYQGKPLRGPIIGSDESLTDIIDIELSEGRFLSSVEEFEQECVIGAKLAEQIKEISMENPINQPIRLGNALYTIIGVAKPWTENGFFNENINLAVMIPIAGTIAINKNATINNAIMRIKPKSNIDNTINSIQAALLANAPQLKSYIRSSKQIIDSMEKQGHIFTLLLAVIGSIALLVGGVGVMNIMLVSVSERKKEIGIRKACGSTKSNIQALFLVESVILSLLGGISGLITGVVCTLLVTYFAQWPFKVFLMPLLVGFTVSVVIGVFFGFYPARRAADLEPAVSLRGS